MASRRLAWSVMFVLLITGALGAASPADRTLKIARDEAGAQILLGDFDGVPKIQAQATPARGARDASPAPLLADASSRRRSEARATFDFVLDDGTVDNNIGIGGTWEFLWGNRFTPAAGDFPFQLTSIQIYFDTTGLVAVGDPIRLVIFENTTGAADPGPGSNLLAQYATTIQALDSWNVFDVSGLGIACNGPGDIFIGAIALLVPGTSYWPAAMDQTTSAQRSWAGWYLTTPPPDPAFIPCDDTWILIDTYFPGNWMVRATGTTSGPSAVLSGVAFTDTCTSGGPGNNDGVADPGENLAYTLTVGNTGAGDLTAVQATLSTATPGVTVTTPTVTYGTILQGGSAPSPTPFAVALDPTLTCASLIDFQLDITATEGTWTGTFQQTVGDVVPGGPVTLIDEAFEVWPPASGGAWTFSHTGCGGWETSAITGRTNYTGGAGNCADADSDDCGSAMTADMVTPPFSLAGSYVSAQLQFRSDFNDFAGSDDGYVDASTDGGTTWTNLFHYDKADFRGPRQETVDLTPYLGNADVRIRFQYVAPGYDWWWEVDDVVVTATTAPTCTMNICTGGAPCTLTCTASAAPASGVVPLTVAFTATATLGPTCIGPASYLWDFGDGATDTAQNPTHIYAAGGSYTWTVTVTVDGVTCTSSGTITADPFGVAFFDDYGRSQLCLNTTTGAFKYTVLTGPSAGTSTSGVVTFTTYNGMMTFRTAAGLPYSLSGKYLVNYNKAQASFTNRPLRISSSLYDNDTTNDPPCF